MNNFKIAREMKGFTQQQVAEALGVDRSTYTKYEIGNIQPDNEKLLQLASIFEVSIDYLLGKTQKTNQLQSYLIPVLGEVPAGVPIEAIENVEEYIDIYPRFVKDGEFFALRVKGKSMEPEINNGDIAIVVKQDFIDSGDVAVVRVNGEDVTVKRVKKQINGLMLIPRNEAFEPVFFSTDQVKSLPVTIVGKVIEIRRRF
jgi:repressor LexA